MLINITSLIRKLFSIPTIPLILTDWNIYEAKRNRYEQDVSELVNGSSRIHSNGVRVVNFAKRICDQYIHFLYITFQNVNFRFQIGIHIPIQLSHLTTFNN